MRLGIYIHVAVDGAHVRYVEFELTGTVTIALVTSRRVRDYVTTRHPCSKMDVIPVEPPTSLRWHCGGASRDAFRGVCWRRHCGTRTVLALLPPPSPFVFSR